MSERGVDNNGLYPFATEETYLRRADHKRARNERGILTFVVGGELYGIEILHVREIIKPREITEVPRVPGYLLGILTVRGQVLPVIDLGRRLHLGAASPAGRRARILVVMREGERFGLLVDAVRDVVRFGDEQIEPPPSTFSPAEAPYLAGIARHLDGDGNEQLVILLQLDAVLELALAERRGT